jgi:ABC-type amino acid transport substrate-binding protein
MMRFLLVLSYLLLMASGALGQNCESIKSGLNANLKPQNTSRDIVGRSLDEIMERGWIRFAIYDDFAPYSFVENGKPAGIDVDLGKLVAGSLGVEARFNVVQAAENVDGDLRNNVWKGPLVSGSVSNVMLHVPYDRELSCRNEQVVLSGRYFIEQIAIAYRKEYYPDDPPLPAYFRFDTVGVENDSLSDFYLSGLANGQIIPKMSRFRATGEAMNALKRGEVMAVMGPLAQLEYAANDDIAVHMPPMPGLAKRQWTLGIAVRHNWRPLGYAVSDAISAAVEDGRMKSIFAKYGLSYKPPDW